MTKCKLLSQEAANRCNIGSRLLATIFAGMLVTGCGGGDSAGLTTVARTDARADARADAGTRARAGTRAGTRARARARASIQISTKGNIS
jgi:hypothetical protein